jgi:hypothetical protein
MHSLIVYADLMTTINTAFIIMLNLGFKPQWGQEIFFSKIIQAGSGAHHASYTMGIW